MAFLPAISGWMREPPGPRCTMHVMGYGKIGERRRITFCLSRELVDLAGWHGGERFVLALGTGDDIGLFQLSRADHPRAGLKLIPHSRARGFRLNVSRLAAIHGIDVHALLDPLPNPIRTEFSVESGAIVIRPVSAAAAAGPSNVVRL